MGELPQAAVFVTESMLDSIPELVFLRESKWQEKNLNRVTLADNTAVKGESESSKEDGTSRLNFIIDFFDFLQTSWKDEKEILAVDVIASSLPGGNEARVTSINGELLKYSLVFTGEELGGRVLVVLCH
ncbi:hypothetical protein Tco_0580936 [Tanacetum coccineum]